VIKALGLKFRGRQAWPLFRSFRPGYFPWYLEAQEARFLAVALEQTLEVAPRIREDPALLAPGDEECYLVRVSREEGGALVWEDQVVSVPPVEPASIPIPMDLEALEVLKGLPQSRASLEMDFFMLPARIGERGDRPSFAYDSSTSSRPLFCRPWTRPRSSFCSALREDREVSSRKLGVAFNNLKSN
jgi:hypothetical protein